VPGHVRDDDAKPAPVAFPLTGKLEDVEVVAADRRRRLEEGGELDSLDLESLARNQVLLNLAGELEFPLQGPPGRSLGDQAFEACRDACDPRFSDYAIYEHCLPFNVARAYDEALGIDTPRIWTAERDRRMWAELQGDG